jgi:hypothetical protein
MPVSVFPKLCAASFAVGVLTELSEDEGLFCVVPRLFPVVPWLSAFEVLDPGVPPGPLTVLTFEDVFPADPRAPLTELELLKPAAALPVLCASATEELLNKMQKAIAVVFKSLS